MRNKLSSTKRILIGVLVLFFPHSGGVFADTVSESARDIPVAYDVDVVVVGGSVGGVAAAIAAAESGAEVFLAAPRPYLGEDMCGTYRMWLEPNETSDSPLACEMFGVINIGLSFSYETDIPAGSPHLDTVPPSVLTDGKYSSAVTESVQYNGDVNIIADLATEPNITRVKIMAYQRNGTSTDFEVESVIVSVSNDKQNWTQVASIPNNLAGQGDYENQPIVLSADISETARYVKFFV